MSQAEVSSSLPLVVITGPTASGKTSLAIKLAEQFGGEIICADSRTVYRGMDIGTAKPTPKEQSVVPHWGLDLVDPGERFTVADFKSYALGRVADIRRRGKVPFLVGGTGLYIDAVIFDFQFASEVDIEARQQLESLSVAELQDHCINNNISLPKNQPSKRYLVRAIEQKTISTICRQRPIDDCVVVGITTDKLILRTRIDLRAEQLLSNVVVEEATELAEKYGWDSQAMTGNIYPLIRKFVSGELTRDQLRLDFIKSDRGLAKRQLTWLRRNPFILWADLEAAEQYLSNYLSSEHRSMIQ